MKILVATLYGNFLTEVLQQCNHDIIIVNDKNNIISSLQANQSDVVMIDQQFDAFQYMKQIDSEEEFHKIVMIYVSSDSHDINLIKAIDAGFDDYFIQTNDEMLVKIYIKRMQHLSDLKKQLFYYSTQDALTEMGNAKLFENRLLKSIEDADETQLLFALLFIDLDNFKVVNDNIGHLMGDVLLKEIAKRLKSCLRHNDFIARMGGEQFVIILKDIENAYDVDTIAKKILESMMQSFTIHKTDVRIKFNIGIALYPNDGHDAASILQNADIARYYAKKLGHDQYQFHSSAKQLQYKQLIELENDLNFALEKKEFILYYQPVYDLKQKKIIGLETLLRWHHKVRGLILPDVFIPLAEESGIIFQMTEWVLEEVCRQAYEWELEHVKNFKISFNVSASLLLQKNLTKSILSVIQKSGLPIELFDAEITETVLLSNSVLSENVIRELKQSGLTFSVDDFGTGYSSFTHLKLLPLRAIKIDKSFINNIVTDAKDTIIVEAIIDIGNRMNVDVVAEGIETEEQLKFLVNKNCKKGQGYLLCPPLSVEKMSILLKNSVTKQ